MHHSTLLDGAVFKNRIGYGASERCRLVESKVSTFEDQVNHAFMTIGAFPVAAPIGCSGEGDQEYTITTNAGFSCRRPCVSAAMAIFMLR